MTIFSLYIFDRHCDCIYYQDWNRTRPLRAPSTTNFKPGVHRLAPAQPSQTAGTRESIFSSGFSSGGIGTGITKAGNAMGSGAGASQRGLPFDEEAKLVYGVVLSLRNMVKKLSGRDEPLTSYSTPHYKLHLYETLTGYRFVLLSDPSSDSLRFVLRQLYTGAFLEYVVRNPLIDMDSRTEGIDNDQFRSAVDRHMKSLSVFS
ncbi:Sybindin-like protein [Kockovaella imperatae]|uniref:Trafficking protein particle complex subunit n=1 Tax=Kockovaella imperatae TaxID=4999 RepID=A0A1Y1UEP8_9TREE|nr:Sybindin-like protein [Kockovaella imperatae]ORX36498.1 Sybindin-like protein [Kockovaella imperatae]